MSEKKPVQKMNRLIVFKKIFYEAISNRFNKFLVKVSSA
jgi:hypothetical protein